MSNLFKPKIVQPPAPVATPVVNQEIVDRNAADLMRRRRGSRATQTGAANLGTTAGSVASKELLGQ
jgi:hypothetical protein